MSDINVSNIASLDQNQVNKILSLTKQLCSIEYAFVYYRNSDTDVLITTEESGSFDGFYILYKQVFSKGIEINKDNLDQSLSSFRGIPIYNAKKEIVAAFCLVNKDAIRLNSFQSDTLQVYLSALSNCFTSSAEVFLEKDYNFALLQTATPYFLVTDIAFKIIEVGLNFCKSVSSIKKGHSLFDYFLLDRSDDLTEESLTDEWYDLIHFLDLKDGLQSYKCSIRRFGDLYFIWASPIINAKYALENYNVTVHDFPNHDTIAEYLFLEHTSRKSLEESRETTKNLLAKNREISRI